MQRRRKLKASPSCPSFISMKQLVGWALHKHHDWKSSVQIRQAWLRLSKVVCYKQIAGFAYAWGRV